jgi:beta-mannosidase
VQDENRRSVVFTCQLLQDGKLLTCLVGAFAPPKHLEMVEPGIQVSAKAEGEQLVIDLTAKTLARFVELSFEGQDVVFSDNYFDLPASCQVRVTCPLPQDITADSAQSALRVRSLYDSF